MKGFPTVPLPEAFVKEIDEKRGYIPRATYVREIIREAWRRGCEVKGA